jgi:hypothetical protein
MIHSSAMRSFKRDHRKTKGRAGQGAHSCARRHSDTQMAGRGLPAQPFPNLFDRDHFVTLCAWTCLSAKNFRTRFHNGLPTAVGFSSPLMHAAGEKSVMPWPHR